jgi:hypothetical protein
MAIFPNQTEQGSADLCALQVCGFESHEKAADSLKRRSLRYPLFKKPGNIIGSIGRVDDEVNMLWHDDKSELCKSPVFASGLDGLYNPTAGPIARQQRKPVIAGEGEFMSLSRKIEVITLSSDRGIHLNVIGFSSRNKDTFSVLSRVMRNRIQESQKARARLRLSPWHPGTNNGLPWPPAVYQSQLGRPSRRVFLSLGRRPVGPVLWDGIKPGMTGVGCENISAES